MAEQHIVKFWRGKRKTYNLLKENNKLDYWTRYSIIENDGSVSEMFGTRVVNTTTGQILPVLDIVKSLEDIKTPEEGERYLVGHDADAENPEAEYNLYILKLSETGEIIDKESLVEPFLTNYSVRVVNRFMKCYQLVEGVMTTYDDVDCGTF